MTPLLALILLPLVGALALTPLKRDDRTAKWVALAFAIVELLLIIPLWAVYSPGGARIQEATSMDWIPSFGIHISFGVDGIALIMIAVIAFLVPIVMGVLGTADRLPQGRSVAGFFALILVQEALTIGVFAATDVFLFYVLFEIMLIPMYFLIGGYGGANRQYAAVKFFLYSFLGGLIMLASAIGAYALVPGKGTFDWATLVTVVRDAPLSTQVWLFLGFFLAFAIKAPLVPFHTWLPDAAGEAPIGVVVLLVGVLDKVGTFGFLRYCLPLFPLASVRLAPLVLVLSVIGILYGALLAVGQKDMSRFVAYTSIAHFGFIALGIFAFSTQAFAGSVLYMVNHGLSTGMLFVMVGLLAARGGSRMINDYGGVVKLAPVLAGCFLLAGLSSLALPGTNSFVSEFLVLVGSFPREPVYTVLATVGIVFAALYVLWVYQQTMQGPVRGRAVLDALERSPAGGPGAMIDPAIAARRAGSGFPDLSVREIVVLVPLIVAILVLGFFPGPVLDVVNPSVAATMTEVGLTDPVGGLPR
jgi:NADH-quinone oxidoreductase subunit M